MGAILSFLGGAAFRLIWGSVTDFLNKKQEHKQELEAIRLQADIAAQQHARDLERLKVASELGIRELLTKGRTDLDIVDAKGFAEATAAALKPVGIRWVDAWNGIIRPCAASIALLLWVMALINSGFVLSNWDTEMVGVILGFYFAARTITRGR